MTIEPKDLLPTFATGEEYHLLAEEYREQRKDFEGSLALLDKAISLYAKEARWDKLALAHQSQVLAYKHLMNFPSPGITSEEALQKAKEAAQKSMDVANAHPDETKAVLGACYFRLGEVALLGRNYSEAVEYFGQAVTNHQGTNAERGDFRYHLGEALVLTGKKEEGIQTILQGIEEIQTHTSEVGDFLEHVWVSGAYMRLAEILREDKPDEARRYLTEAKKIIDSDPRLKIRKDQWEHLAATFSR